MLKRPPLAVAHERSRLLCAVDACASARALREILARAVLSGLWREPFVAARVVAACATVDLPLAQLAFDASPRRSAFSYTVMIRAHSSGPTPSQSLALFSRMLRSGLYPDRFAFPFLLRATARSLSPPSSIHALALRHGLDGDAHVATSLLHAYASCGLLDNALLVFEGMSRRSEISWSAIIFCCARSQQREQDGLSLFSDMISTGARPNVDTLIATLSCCAANGLMTQVRALHALSIRLLPSPSLDEVGTSLISVYSRSGSLEVAVKVFDKIRFKDSSTWTAMIGGLAMHGRGEEAVSFFGKMAGVKNHLLRPDDVTITAVLHACSHSGLVDAGLKLFNELQTVHGVEAKMEHYGAMVDMFGRAGRLEDAERVAASMPFAPNRVVWGSLLHACAVRGRVAYAEKLEKELLGSEEDEIGGGGGGGGGFFVGLSNAYAGACRWQEVGRLRESMAERAVRKEGAFSLVEVGGATHKFLVGDDTHPSRLEIYTMLHRIHEEILLI